MKPKHQRLLYLLVGMAVLALAAGLMLNALKREIVFFYTPSELAGVGGDRPMRVGGLVLAGSLSQDGTTHRFRISDGNAELDVRYEGMLPALFREGQGVVAEGRLDGAHFAATRVLAKHDEKYMPPEVEKKLKATGYWKPDTGQQTP